MYRLLFSALLKHIPPEAAHAIATGSVRVVGAIPGTRRLARRLLAPQSASLVVDAFGLRFPSPLGAAAGLDKNLTWFEELGSLGFGFVEVGTVTAVAQRGNAKPRIHRLLEDRALVNSMGFPNKGAMAARERLRKRKPRTIVAVNVGKSKVATDVLGDYRATVRHLAPYAGLIVLNVSSPNTRGLRDLQQLEALRELIVAVRSELEDCGATPPLAVKISPDLPDDELDRVADLAVDLELDGIVAVNTTTTRPPLKSLAGAVELHGGLSGPPLQPRAVDVLRRLYARTRGEVALVSVGGVETAEDAWERICAGATLVQAYTGFIYGGPLWAARVNRGLARLARVHGVSNLQDAIGSSITSVRTVSSGAGRIENGPPPAVDAPLRMS